LGDVLFGDERAGFERFFDVRILHMLAELLIRLRGSLRVLAYIAQQGKEDFLRIFDWHRSTPFFSSSGWMDRLAGLGMADEDVVAIRIHRRYAACAAASTGKTAGIKEL